MLLSRRDYELLSFVSNQKTAYSMYTFSQCVTACQLSHQQDPMSQSVTQPQKPQTRDSLTTYSKVTRPSNHLAVKTKPTSQNLGRMSPSFIHDELSSAPLTQNPAATNKSDSPALHEICPVVPRVEFGSFNEACSKSASFPTPNDAHPCSSAAWFQQVT